MNHDDARTLLTRKILARRPEAMKYDAYYAGTNPLAWISNETRKEVATFGSLNVNYSRLVCELLAQKLEIVGLHTTAGREKDDDLFGLWESMDMSHKSQLAHTEALVFGRAYFTVWSGPDGGPNVMPESSLQCSILRDPITGATVAGLKRWLELDGTIRALLFTTEDITEYVGTGSPVTDSAAASVLFNSGIDDLRLVERQPNTLGVVPLICLTNRPRLGSPDGESELVDIVPLVDALNKVTLDMLLTSTYSAFPRRWVTGLFPESPTGYNASVDQQVSARANVAQVWEQASRAGVWIAPNDRTTFGQFPEASLDGFRNAIMLFLGQISAVGSIPPQFMSILGSNPQSAEAIRAQESRLVAKAIQRQRQWSQSYEDLMRLCVLIRDGRPDPALDDMETVWRPADDKPLSQLGDAVVKLVQSGVIDREAALAALGYSPQDITSITDRASGLESLGRIIVDNATGDSPARASHITVSMPERPPMRKRVETDSHGRIVAVVEEPA